ncbi:MAG: hypothetical protein KAX38_03790, partial [Candidatus Krumholzibacteria bacterium]|nr:hypothetical protein [Candidatus Krumholzibacteria bacterium]
NVGSSDPSEITEVAAFCDLGGDGLFEPAQDSLLEVAEFNGVYYVFDELNMIFEPYKSCNLFITYNTALHAIRDSVKVNFQVSNKDSLGFKEKTVNIQGEFPLNSAGLDITDGMISAQIDLFPIEIGRVSPGEIDVPCLSFRLPCNGTLEDKLRSLSLENLGTAEPSIDIAYLKIWKESGGRAREFDPGQEQFVDFLSWDGSCWRSVSQLSDSIPCEGLILHVTADISSTALDGRTVHLSIPINGVQVLSGNDGPIDGSADSPAVIEVTTDPLFVRSFEFPLSVTREQIFDVHMLVYNAGDTTLISVVPDSFSYAGSGSLVLLSGPVPEFVDLAGGSESAFVWSFQAASPGKTVFRGRAVESGGSEVSQFEFSDTLLIEAPPDHFTVTFGDLSPVSLNRGEKDASMIEVLMDYGSSCVLCAGVEFASLNLFFTDGSGSPVAVKDVASKVSLKDESMVLYSAATTGLNEPVISLFPTDPVLFVPGDSRTFHVSIDVAGSALAGDFRLHVQAVDDLELRDRNSHSPVQFSGTVFPWSTNVVTLKDPASELLVRDKKVLPEYVNRGQENVETLELVVSNSGGLSAADISVSEIVFKTTDAGGDSVGVGEVFKLFRIDNAIGATYCSYETFSPSAYIQCKFKPALNVSSQMP